MPYLFIHGIGQRRSEDGGDGGFEKGETTRDILTRRLFLSELERSGKWPGLNLRSPVNPYWGNLGVKECWDTIPRAIGTEAQGAATDGTGAATLAADAEWLHKKERGIAAQDDLLRYLEACVAPVFHGEALPDATQREAGETEALLLLAIEQVARDPEVVARVAELAGDESAQLLELRRRVARTFESLASSAEGQPELEEQGAREWLAGVKTRIGELFDRVDHLPARTVSLAGLALTREGMSNWTFPRLGDVFVYLRDPEPILQHVSAAIRTACEQAPGERLILMTHSMGGNVLYDLLTHYAERYPLGRRVDAWISVGGQIGLFEAMKLFRESDPSVKEPQKLPRPASVDRWINVYDPADILSYLAEPVFEGVIDERYSTGGGALSAHGDYFLRPSFYRLLLGHLT